ncbi:HPr family phosphocarrier protein [Herbiconiux sp.]|uniref:HPr family phosphocarrier protein n=1 Tax=Herbiconiux sp. TaxID=1871186 RepID=UPI0025BA3B21|nr:HPr family phosphocarrier protein [Herbiconiux sp.]
MPERRFTVTAPSGLHARPVGIMVKAVTESGHAVTIGRPDATAVDARSILAVLGLGFGQGDEVVLHSDDESADAFLGELAETLAAAE